LAYRWRESSLTEFTNVILRPWHRDAPSLGGLFVVWGTPDLFNSMYAWLVGRCPRWLRIVGLTTAAVLVWQYLRSSPLGLRLSDAAGEIFERQACDDPYTVRAAARYAKRNWNRQVGK
jgi:hypothetical protein